jgi:hypothetical protein
MAKYNIIKLQFPEERRLDKSGFIGLDTYVMTRYAKLGLYSEEENAILLDTQETPEELCKTVQDLMHLPSGVDYSCDSDALEVQNLSAEEKAWLDSRIQVRRELIDEILPNHKEPLISPDLHLLTLHKAHQG